MRSFVVPKGNACALHLSPEFQEGKKSKDTDINPYSFWDEYLQYYAWDIGRQERNK